MKIRELLDKGIDTLNAATNMVGRQAENLGKKIEDKKQSIDKYNYLVSISNHLDNMQEYKENNEYPSVGREQLLLSLCLTLNVEKAGLINKIIPVYETPINVITFVESKTQMDYILVVTDKRVWILNKNEYKTYKFEDITKFEIVNKSLLSQGVNFNNNALSFEGSEQVVSELSNILTNEEYRKSVIEESIKYLCGVTPKISLTSLYYTGITIGVNNEIVLHISKDESHLINKDDIKYIQILLDNKVILQKDRGNNNQVSALSPARKMTVKVKANTKEYSIDVLRENVMGTAYKIEDSAFQNAYDLAKKIVDTIDKIVRS